MNTLWHDIRHGLRLLSKSKMFTVVATVSLALGIGANTAVFSLINALILRGLPVRAPERLVVLTTSSPVGERNRFAVPVFREIEKQQQVFSISRNTGTANLFR